MTRKNKRSRENTVTMPAIKLKPYLFKAHVNLGLVYYQMGQLENARRELITGLNMKPDDQSARQLLKALTP